MKSKDQDRFLVLAIALLSLAALFYGGIAMIAWLAGHGVSFKDFDLAAWTQAIGSVGALVGIWYSVHMQRRMMLDAEQRARQAAAHTASIDASTAVAAISAELELMHGDPSHITSLRCKMHRSRLQEGRMLSQAVQLSHLPIEKRAATIALRQIANAVIDCIDAGAAAETDQQIAHADYVLASVVGDQLEKVQQFEQVLRRPN